MTEADGEFDSRFPETVQLFVWKLHDFAFGHILGVFCGLIWKARRIKSLPLCGGSELVCLNIEADVSKAICAGLYVAACTFGDSNGLDGLSSWLPQSICSCVRSRTAGL